jgi:hypothetical protein
MTDATVKSSVATKVVAPVSAAVKATSASVAAKRKPAAAPAKKAAPAVKKAAPAAKPAAAVKKKAPAKAAKPVVAAKPAKTKKPKMVRDSMTMPKAEYAVLAELKLRATKLARPVKKTELLRAGIKALAAMSDASFIVALKAVPSLKTGRPSKS